MDNPKHLLVSSTLTWFRDNDNRARNVINHVHDLLDEEFPSLGLTPREMFRPNQLVTVRSNHQPVPAAAERLIRWDGEPPTDIFVGGFWPHVPSPPDTFDNDAFRLSTYVSKNDPSIFVGTTQPYRVHNRIYNWAPRDHAKAAFWDTDRAEFEYEIFSYGGIDVNRVLGNHEFDNQHEIAFPGGIRSVFIRAAREYRMWTVVRRDPNGQSSIRKVRFIARIHRNQWFNPAENPQGHAPGSHLPPNWSLQDFDEELPN